MAVRYLLLALVDHFIAEGFVDTSLRDFIHAVPDITSLEEALAANLS